MQLVNGRRNHQSVERDDSENKENADNERLMQRLTSAANVSNVHMSKMTHASHQSRIGDKTAYAVSHEEWIRKKEH